MNDPQTKITPPGFLQMLLENGTRTQVTNIDSLLNGSTRTVTLRYQQRGLESQVSDDDDCETDIIPQWQQSDLSNPAFAKIGLEIDEATLRSLQEEARTLQLLDGRAVTSQDVVNAASALQTNVGKVPYVLVETLRTQINSLISKIDTDLVAAQATAWGKNIATGSNAAQDINLANTPDLNDGIVKILDNANINEIYGPIQIVGNGLISRYKQLQLLKTGIDGGGFGALNLNIYDDVKTATSWGANHFGVFAQGNIAFVDWSKYKFIKQNADGSVDFPLPLSLTLSNGKIFNLTFDCTIMYDRCAGGGGKYKLIIAKNYGLWNLPANAFASADRLNGYNGSLHYIGVANNATTIIPAEGAVFTTQEAG
ncbi:hypothetical protein FACS189434_07990 [Bacteroidia bacterium]|nr:hypothetical protein FACS189434_07990 [Bacteroidia bacterium]